LHIVEDERAVARELEYGVESALGEGTMVTLTFPPKR
jgi:hypothetical protein